MTKLAKSSVLYTRICACLVLFVGLLVTIIYKFLATYNCAQTPGTVHLEAKLAQAEGDRDMALAELAAVKVHQAKKAGWQGPLTSASPNSEGESVVVRPASEDTKLSGMRAQARRAASEAHRYLPTPLT